MKEIYATGYQHKKQAWQIEYLFETKEEAKKFANATFAQRAYDVWPVTLYAGQHEIILAIGQDEPTTY